jgi:predicted 2-oxoglutarate/Fe(II)-dependent dioxygenase YbiX
VEGSLDFFRKRGFLLKATFLDHETCAELCEELQRGIAHPAEIIGGPDGAVDPSIRNAGDVELTSDLAMEVGRRILGLRDEIATHFRVAVAGCEGPSFLVYRPGGFYEPHRDRTTGDLARESNATARRISVVVFLNAVSRQPGPNEYSGGALTFYGLFDDPAWREYGFAIDPTPGLLVAFPSDLLHEVTPVTAGVRYTVVDWLHA